MKDSTATGLGLWISRRIAGNHHGSIRVRSLPGRGTVFCHFPHLGAAGNAVAWEPL